MRVKMGDAFIIIFGRIVNGQATHPWMRLKYIHSVDASIMLLNDTPRENQLYNIEHDMLWPVVFSSRKVMSR